MIIKLMEYLIDNEIKVYLPGQHKGDCAFNYVVLKDGGTSGYMGSNKIGTQLIDVIFFVPQNKYSKCEEFKNEIKTLLEEFPGIRYTGDETGVITDDSVKGLTFSVMYESQKIIGGI